MSFLGSLEYFCGRIFNKTDYFDVVLEANNFSNAFLKPPLVGIVGFELLGLGS